MLEWKRKHGRVYHATLNGHNCPIRDRQSSTDSFRDKTHGNRQADRPSNEHAIRALPYPAQNLRTYIILFSQLLVRPLGSYRLVPFWQIAASWDRSMELHGRETCRYMVRGRVPFPSASTASTTMSSVQFASSHFQGNPVNGCRPTAGLWISDS